MDIDKLSNTEQLRPDQRELADIIGLDAYKKLIYHYAVKARDCADTRSGLQAKGRYQK